MGQPHFVIGEGGGKMKIERSFKVTDDQGECKTRKWSAFLGTIVGGTFAVNQNIMVTDQSGEKLFEDVVDRIEIDHQPQKQAQQPNNIGLQLKHTTPKELEKLAPGIPNSLPK